jgi:hypothetical protein
MKKLLVSMVSSMLFAAGLVGCQCHDTGLQPVIGSAASQPSVSSQRISRGMKMSVVRSRLRSVGAARFPRFWPTWAFGHGGDSRSTPPPKKAYRSLFYRLPGDTVVWLLGSGPRGGTDDQYVLTNIGLTEEGAADEFEQSSLSPRELLKQYPQAIVVSKEGLVEVIPQEDDSQS